MAASPSSADPPRSPRCHPMIKGLDPLGVRVAGYSCSAEGLYQGQMPKVDLALAFR